MACIRFIQILLICLFILSFIAADDTKDGNVAIGPVENVTAIFTGYNSIFISWDPPPVYVMHDLINATLDGDDSEGGASNSGRPAHSAITNESSNIASTNDSSGAETNGGNDTTTGLPSSNDVWKCKPLSFFNNYTVDMKQEMDIGNPSMAVAFKDSLQKYQIPKVKVTNNQKIVWFSEGCIAKYEISYGKTETDVQVLIVSANSYTANLTGLIPDTQYKIVIRTIYVNGDSFETIPPAYISTKKVTESQACSCDMFGAFFLNCKFNGVNFCNCKTGYEGSFCELCSPGYYRTAPHFPCHRCPCDTQAARKSTCQFVEGFLQCDKCEVGYTGSTCHICDKGFYRYKHHCVLCHCNGNTSPTAKNVCAPTTGSCIDSCQYNTTGFHCERCLPGYIGDPISFKNCTLESEVRVHGLMSKSSSSDSSGVVVGGVVITILLLILLVVAFILFRRYYSKEKRRAFWTIEMKRDKDDVDFTSVHNDDAHLDDADDMDYFTRHGITSSSNKYSRLQEDI